MPEVRPATPDMFEDVYPLLQEFPQSRLSKEDWRRMLFDWPWPTDEPHRGYVLVDGRTIVGFIGTIFSTRRVGGRDHPFCNLSSWIVSPGHRASSLQLLGPILAMRTHTIVNLSPSRVAHEIFSRLGFEGLETYQILIPLIAGPGEMLTGFGVKVTTRPSEIRPQLDEGGRVILDDMGGTLARQLLLRHRGRHCHVIATRSPWKGRWRLAHVHYASDWSLFWELLSPAAWGFFRTLGTLGLRVDDRHALGRRPRLAVRRELAIPLLYRPSSPEITPQTIDGLYSELVCQRW